ncbi:hypothetical protein NDU88_011453 [Pleurodeles waltl]|uniref:Uncharacterized protein n=1 Tax=Pleurodeles waltl TaxID=8319 RepID=A0AAV7S689_PLEWA|nr:hypothetical protein NDU88_011453 [Pleurodeles waltl]
MVPSLSGSVDTERTCGPVYPDPWCPLSGCMETERTRGSVYPDPWCPLSGCKETERTRGSVYPDPWCPLSRALWTQSAHVAQFTQTHGALSLGLCGHRAHMWPSLPRPMVPSLSGSVDTERTCGPVYPDPWCPLSRALWTQSAHVAQFTQTHGALSLGLCGHRAHMWPSLPRPMVPSLSGSVDTERTCGPVYPDPWCPLSRALWTQSAHVAQFTQTHGALSQAVRRQSAHVA